MNPAKTPASISAPKSRYATVTPSDSVDFLVESDALFVGGAGAVSVVSAGGDVVMIMSAASQYHPLRAVRVNATGTTATDIVRLWD